MTEDQIHELVLQEKRKYAREWRANNKEKAREANARYWRKRAERKAREQKEAKTDE